MTTSRPPALLLLSLVLVILLAACGGGAARPESSPADQRQTLEAPVSGSEKRAEPGKPAGAARPGVTAPGAAAPAAKPAESAADANRPAGGAGAAQAATPAPSGRVAAAANQVPPLDQRIIRTGRIDMVVADISGALRSITDIIRGAGGYVQQSATRDQGTVAIAEMILRVPVEQYDTVFQGLRDLAVPDKKPTEDSSSQDVTEEFADTQARIKNLKATEEQILRLLAKAEKIEDILVIQRELTGVREQIERLQGRLNVLERRAAFSTITVTLRPREEAKRPNPPALGQPVAGANEISTRPVFTWSISEGASSYTLQVAGEIDTTFASPILTIEKLTATSFEWPESVEELRAGTTYRWRVRASNAAGDGEWATARSFRTVPVWNPVRNASESWAASLKFLQRVIDGLLSIVIFFWWLIPLVLLAALGLRGRRPRLPGRGGPPAATTPPPPAA